MNKPQIIGLCLSVMISLSSCHRKDREPESKVLGTLSVDLDANEAVVRKREALIGNMILDAFKNDMENRKKDVDFFICNSGNIRFNGSKRPNGIYTAGDFTADMADEMLPFGNTNVIVTMTGMQLKEVFERSFAQYPLAKGPFLQVSKELQVVVDSSGAPQILDITNTTIVSPGSRVVSIKFNSMVLDSVKEYRVGTSSHIAEGNDGYITFNSIPGELKEYIEDDQANALKEYIITKTPISAKKEGRIVFQ